MVLTIGWPLLRLTVLEIEHVEEVANRRHIVGTALDYKSVSESLGTHERFLKFFLRKKGPKFEKGLREVVGQMLLWGAVAGAMQHAKVSAPGAYSFAILMRHGARDLVQVRQVVSGPGREQLRQSHCAESGM